MIFKFCNNRTNGEIEHFSILSVIFFLATVIVTACVLLLRKPENRERCRQSVTRFGEQTVTLCRSFGRRRRADDQRNLLGNRVRTKITFNII